MTPAVRRLARVVATGAACIVVAAALASCGGGGASASVTPPAGITTRQPVPPSVSGLPFVDQSGAPSSLAAFRGKVLVLAPFLTSCQEECPLTTGAFLTIQRDIRQAGLSGRVQLAELTVDPGRDVPSRLAAYAGYTGSDWTLLTGSPAAVDAFWHHFGVYYSQVPEANPPGIDWQTGKPYTYDMDHSNGFMIFDQSGRERFLTGDLPNLHGDLSPALRKLLDNEGVQNLQHPDATGSWTVPQALAAIGAVLGTHIPAG